MASLTVLCKDDLLLRYIGRTALERRIVKLRESHHMSERGVFAVGEEKVGTLSMTGIIGPFNSVHKKLLAKAYSESKISSLLHQLTCFEVVLEVCLGQKILTKLRFSPSEIRPTCSPFQQLLIFSLATVSVPADFLTMPQCQIRVILVHRIADFPETKVAEGRIIYNGREIVFPLHGDVRDDLAAAVTCDLMRSYKSVISVPIFNRAPSPAPNDAAQPVNLSEMLSSVKSSAKGPYIGDIGELSASVTTTFAGLLVGPEHPEQYSTHPLEKNHIRLFKPDSIPPRYEIPKIQSIVMRPFIAGITNEERELLKKYRKFASGYASGYMKLVSTGFVDREPKLPVTIALFLLTPSRFKLMQSAKDHALRSLYEAPKEEIRRFASWVIAQVLVPEVLQFVVARAKEDPEFAVSAYWAFQVEISSPKRGHLFKKQFDKWKGESPEIFEDLEVGAREFQRLEKIVAAVKSISPRDAKVAFVKSELSQITFEKPFRLPLCPSFVVQSVSTENIIVFGSSLQPVKMDFVDSKGQKYSAILKVGDDMRQDALALTVIRFIDDNIKRFHIDMYLTPYSVVPISRVYGLCEFVVGAKALSKVLAQTNNTIEDFFDVPTKEICREKFVRSSAAYTVISYVLGVGDRHLDNLLMTSNGNFFHVDFGFMFGQDPKPLPCAVRVVGEMVTAFDQTGKRKESGYFAFLWHCEVIYNAIRRKADEFCCLIALMASAELPHLPADDSQIAKILMDRLHLELTEKEAGKLIVNEIEKSVAALLPKLYEWLHRARKSLM